MTESIRKAVLVLLSKILYQDMDILALSDDDIELGLYLKSQELSAVNASVRSLELIFEAELERGIGAAISKIREAEGIDPDQIDQILGVEEVDL